MSKASTAAILPASAISHRIYFLRKTRVMLDSDLAQLYGVTTSNLNQAVRRNYNRFPKDFMFQLTKKHVEVLRSQFAISNKVGRGGRRYLPHAFTEHGIAMLSSVLHSDRAVQVISPSCAPSYNSAPCSPLTKTCAARSLKWKTATTPNSMPFSPLSARCWRPQFRPSDRSDFTPEPKQHEPKIRPAMGL
jgi:hypothetical protein